MFIKVKHILLIIFISVIFILFSKIIKKDGLLEEISNEITQTEETTRYNMKYTYPQMLKMLIEKNSDWSKLPLSKGFKRKYNSKDGILGDIKFDKVEMNPEFGGKYPFEDTAYFVITQGLKKTAYGYRYVFENDKLLEDVLFPDIYHLTDENGNEIDYRLTINKESYYSRLGNLAFGGEHEQSIAVTENFHKKYPYFLDLFIHYSPIECNNIELIDCTWERKEAYFEVDSILECIKRRYKVKFFIDENGYLDDAEVKLVGEYPYQFGYLIQAYDSVFYKNSNWDHLKLTDNFRKKYKKELGVFKDIDLIDYNISYDVERYKSNSIVRYKYKDGTHKWFYEKYIYVDNDYLDDVEILPIDYSGENAKEAKEAYIKQYE